MSISPCLLLFPPPSTKKKGPYKPKSLKPQKILSPLIFCLSCLFLALSPLGSLHAVFGICPSLLHSVNSYCSGSFITYSSYLLASLWTSIAVYVFGFCRIWTLDARPVGILVEGLRISLLWYWCASSTGERRIVPWVCCCRWQRDTCCDSMREKLQNNISAEDT